MRSYACNPQGADQLLWHFGLVETVLLFWASLRPVTFGLLSNWLRLAHPHEVCVAYKFQKRAIVSCASFLVLIRVRCSNFSFTLEYIDIRPVTEPLEILLMW